MGAAQRLQSWLAGLWAGLVLAVGGLAAPTLFAVLERQQAGQGAGGLFAVEARVTLLMAAVMFVMERQRHRRVMEQGAASSAMNLNLLLVLAALFLTVLGYFALQPMMQAAKAGQPTALPFGALHGISAVLYWVKVLVLLALAWRLSGPGQAALSPTS